MKRTRIVVLAAVALLAALPAAGQTADVSKLLTESAKQAQNAMAIVSFNVGESGEARPVFGQALCIHKDDKDIGTFMTLSMSPNVKPQDIKDIRLILPGAEGKTLQAEFVGVDPSSGIGFVRAKEPYKWSPITFKIAPLAVGEAVASVGLMPPDTGYEPYVGLAYVATTVRVPEKLIRVTGGALTNIGSPVFAADGKAVGIVARQLPGNYLVEQNNQQVPLNLRNMQDTAYFLPTEEFAYVLKDPPDAAKPRRLPWMGVLSFDAPGDTMMTDKSKPAVVVGRVIPGQPAEKAGLKQMDLVVEVNGQGLEKFSRAELTQASFLRQFMRMKPGEKVTMKVIREGKPLDTPITVTLGEMPMRDFEAEQYVVRSLGMAVRDKVELDKYARDPVPDVPGVLAYVQEGSPAASGSAPMRNGDVITVVNKQPVPNVAVFKQVIEKALVNPKEVINLSVNRGGKDTLVQIQPPAAAPAPAPAPAGGR